MRFEAKIPPTVAQSTTCSTWNRVQRCTLSGISIQRQRALFQRETNFYTHSFIQKPKRYATQMCETRVDVKRRQVTTCCPKRGVGRDPVVPRRRSPTQYMVRAYCHCAAEMLCWNRFQAHIECLTLNMWQGSRCSVSNSITSVDASPRPHSPLAELIGHEIIHEETSWLQAGVIYK